MTIPTHKQQVESLERQLRVTRRMLKKCQTENTRLFAIIEKTTKKKIPK